MQDAVHLKANCICAATYNDCANILPTEIIRIKVNFKYNGKHYSRLSENDESIHRGYGSFWKKFAGKSIDILYSPKYDQVLILKDDSVLWKLLKKDNLI